MNYNEIALKKGALPFRRSFTAAFFAGLFIAFGALCSQIASAEFAACGGKFAAAAVFPIGLIMVVLVGAELFTGNNLMAYSVYDRSLGKGALWKNWLIVYIGNLVGSLFLVNLVIWGGTYRLFGGQLMKTMIAAAEMKTSLPPHEMFIRAIGCNILVCIAVWCALKAKGTAGKIIATFLPVFAFVYCGFEHSIANMYFIPCGMAAQTVSGGELTISCSGLFMNLLWVTLGNIVGGAVIVAGGLWLIGSEKPAAGTGDNQPKAG